MIIFYFLFFIFYFLLSWFRPKWALVLICGLLPAYQLRFKFFWLPLTLLEAMILILFLVYLLRNTNPSPRIWVRGEIRKKIGSWRWPILAWLAVATLAMFIAPDLWAGAGLWRAYFIEPILFLIVFLSLVKDRRDLNLILAALGVSALYSSVWAIGQRFFGGGVLSQEVLGAPKIWRATGPFPHPNFLGLYLGPIALLIIGKFIDSLRNIASKKVEYNCDRNYFPPLVWKRFIVCGLWFMTFLLSTIAITLARSEGAVLGIAAGLIFLGLIFRPSRRWTLIGVVAVFVIISLLPLGRGYIIQKAGFQDLSGRLRINIWRGTIDLIKENPILGAGLGGYQKLAPEFQMPFYQPETGVLVSVETHPYPHNIFLAIWCELGLAGLIVFLIIIFQFFKLGFQKLFRNLKLEIRNSDPKKDSQILILALLASMVTILIHGLVDTPYFKNDLSILFWLIVGLTIYQNCDKICVTNNKGGRMTRLVIFDYDDTLVRSSEALYKIDSETAHALGLKILTRQEYFALWGKPHNEMIKALYPDVDIDCYLKKYQEIYSDGILQLFDEVKQVLSDLKNRGVKIALLSSKQGEYLEKSLKHLGIRNFFDYIHSAEDSAYHKPDPRVFEGILSYFGFRTDEVVYVGDQLIDFIAAKAAGINFIAMTTGINTKTDFEKSSCQYICNSLKKILLFI